MKILNLNVNDFGGKENHLEEYKKLYGARWCMNKWDKIDKSNIKVGILERIDKFSPDIVIFQEFDINSNDAIDFNDKMKIRGYVLRSEETKWKRPSMTVFFINEQIEYTYINSEHKLNGRAFTIKVKNVVIYGTHIPPKYNDEYWNEIDAFVGKLIGEKYILLGDFNTINYKNNEKLIALLNNKKAYDVWKEKGNPEPISIMGDYVITSQMVSADEVEVDSYDIEFSDHPIVELNLKFL